MTSRTIESAQSRISLGSVYLARQTIKPIAVMSQHNQNRVKPGKIPNPESISFPMMCGTLYTDLKNDFDLIYALSSCAGGRGFNLALVLGSEPVHEPAPRTPSTSRIRAYLLFDTRIQ